MTTANLRRGKKSLGANGGSGSLSGDVTGATSANTVVAIQNNAIKAGINGLNQDGYVLTWTNADNEWEAKPAAGGGFIAGGDLSGTSSSQTVISISGSSPISITPSNLQFTKGTVLPLISQDTPTSDVATTNITIKPQTPFASASTHTKAGNVIVELPADLSGNSNSYFQVLDDASGHGNVTLGSQLTSNSGLGCIWLGGATPNSANMSLYGNFTGSAGTTTVNAGNSQLILNYSSASTLYAYYGLVFETSTASGNFQFGTAGTIDVGNAAGGAIGIRAVTTVPTSNPSGGIVIYANTGSPGSLGLLSSGVQFNTLPTAIKISQDDNTTNSATAANLTIQAQNATGTTSNGGNLFVQSGIGTSTDGYIGLEIGQSRALTVNNNLVIRIHNLSTGVLHADSSGNLTSSTIVNADVNAAAAITYGKLSLTGSIVNADINASAAIVYSKLSLTGSVVNADIASAAAIAVSKLAAGTSAQVLLNNATPAPAWTTISGDVAITNAGVTTVTALQGNAVQSGALGSGQNNYVLTWINGSSQWQATVPSASTLAGPVTATTATNTTHSTYTIDSTGAAHDVIIFHNKSGAVTYTLPAPTAGRLLYIVDLTGAIQTAANNLSIAQHASENISGIAATYTYATNWGTLILTSNATDWFIISR